MSTDWRDNVETCGDAYVYQADIYCGACADDIMDRKQKSPDFDHPNGPPIDTDDSDEWPQGPHADGGGQADSPQHCGSGESCLKAVTLPCGSKIGCPLDHELTVDGIKYTNDLIVQDFLRKGRHARQVGRLWATLFREYLTDDLYKISVKTEILPDDLIDLLMGLRQRDFHLQPDFFLAPEGFIYGGARNAMLQPTSRETTVGDMLWRVEVTPEGNFENLVTIQLPAGELGEYPLEDHLKEAISDGAFD